MSRELWDSIERECALVNRRNLNEHCQDYDELMWYCGKIAGMQGLLEIGSSYGLSLRFAQTVMQGPFVCVDMPARGSDQVLLRAGAKVFFADSKTPDLPEWVARDGPFDVVLIDGDHSERGFSSDWAMYGHLARKMVVFHDVDCPKFPELHRFWASLPGRKEMFTRGVGKGFGILHVD